MDIKPILEAWRAEHGEVLEQKTSNGTPYYELQWRIDGRLAYIDLYPQSDGMVTVQHGSMSGPNGPRQSGGVNRWRSDELPRNLTALKSCMDQAPVQQHRGLRPRLATVASLKLR